MAVVPDVAQGVTRVALPVGLHGIESVNAYVLDDGPHATLVDCGVWHASEDDDGLRALERGLHDAGYALRDVSRIVVTHAHIDHYGLAGRLMELTGAELWMHATTDLDCEKYRHPETAMARRQDTYTDHGVPEAEGMALAEHLARWMPYLHSVVEATRRVRGGEHLVIGGHDWELIHTPGHSLGHLCLWSPDHGVLLSGDHLLPAVTPPVTFERGSDTDPLRSYLESLRRIAEREPRLVLPGHGHPFADAVGRIDAIYRNKIRRMESIRRMIEAQPCTVTDIADTLVAKAILHHQRQLALSETLAHIAYLRWSGLVERRVRRDGTYEWYPTSHEPIPLAAPPVRANPHDEISSPAERRRS